MIKVSIIVPVYNVEQYLDQCVQSLKNQTLHDIEIILVDDESPDNCPKLCDEYARQDSRIKVIHKKNEGLGMARNSGLELAFGEYVAFVDSDDYLDNKTLALLYDTAKKKNTDLILYQFDRFSDDEYCRDNDYESLNIAKEYKTKEELYSLSKDIICSAPTCSVDRVIECSSCAAFYKLSVINDNNIKFHSERELISEDMIFNLDFIEKSTKVLSLSNRFYHYRDNTSSLTHKVRRDKIKKNDILCQYLKNRYDKQKDKDIERRIQRLYFAYNRVALIQVFNSTMPYKDKKSFLDEMVNNPTWVDMAKSYPYKHMSFFQKLFFMALKLRSAMLIRILSMMKKFKK